MSICRNCDAVLDLQPPAAFCPRCGQSTARFPDAVAIAFEFVGRYLRTLAALVTPPGRLSREVLDGRRTRHVAPLRLYLNASLVFFLIVKVLGLSNEIQVEFAALDPQDRIVTRSANPVQFNAAIAEMQACVDRPGRCGRMQTLSARFGLKRLAQSARTDVLVQRFVGYAPYAIFLLLPAFAWLLMLAYRRRGMRYGEHLVVSLHMHTVGFIGLLVSALMPDGAGFVGLMLLLLYGMWALHTVYGGRWWTTLARGSAVGVAYTVALLVLVTGLSIFSILAS